MVEEWKRREDIVVKNIIHYVDTPEIKLEPIIDILKDFKEKSPGPSGITRNFLLNSHKNIIKMYAEVFSASLATGYFPKCFKAAKIVMVPKAGRSPRSTEN